MINLAGNKIEVNRPQVRIEKTSQFLKKLAVQTLGVGV
jgi:hypothetical protein